MRPKTLFVLTVFVLLASLSGFAQQDYVGRWEAYTGYSFFDTPSLNLFQNGFNGEFGANIRPWLALGFDFSVFQGSNSITPGMLNSGVQQQLVQTITEGMEAGLIPPGYRLTGVPSTSTTYTYSAGPQFNIRHFQQVTFFVRPALGALHESASLNPTDPVTKALVVGLVGSSLHKTDTVVFYGFGGGIDFNIAQHVSISTAADLVHYDMFSGLLNGGRNTVRFSIGPKFHFGQNIMHK